MGFVKYSVSELGLSEELPGWLKKGEPEAPAQAEAKEEFEEETEEQKKKNSKKD